jgi:putative oxidoreductase
MNGIANRCLGWAEAIPHSLIALLARLVIAMIFFKSGLTKIDGWQISDSAIFLFENEYKVPLLSPWLAAHLAAMAELTMPVLLVLGLASRLAALALLGMTLVIQLFVYPDAYLVHGLWAVALLTIIARGPGVFSLDHLLRTGTARTRTA